MTTTTTSQANPCDLLCVVGARPNFMKIAPIAAALAAHAPGLRVGLLHTGQHYDAAMNHQYFEALGIPAPDINLEVGSGTHAQQTAEVMRRFEPALDACGARSVLVVGDVNSTIACALVAVKKNIPVIHVEAGLRSFDRGMPEEINRILTDQISDLLFTSEQGARANLLREGIREEAIRFAGNVMIDTLRANLDRALPLSRIVPPELRERHGLTGKQYAVVTLHRPANVDDPAVLASLVDTLVETSKRLPVIFPMHPRTRSMLERASLLEALERGRVAVLPPQGYLEMLGLMKDATVVLTDSGGIQEETTALGVPCITLRESTERPVTVDEGTNTIAGTEPRVILGLVEEVLSTGGKRGKIPEGWEGKASVRIAVAIRDWMSRGCKA
ncbi:non-hydrolyzing UDP-N-acetylglucosamine 2-epimerase [Noviherbaspirillum galbum]|uniref:UDP-N-acetylglucosamine 2-epimerase (Non-hydrolyzing) n=1 Tax=Noviherbaspirillum galbum TaxID=2709383 RepID=A0A6B3STR0_9BURK|nr:UDP-N-acetylglucosamine 2-epimerase (non-hydrolyzing) [Noviherbaspirillum galbum]NEX64183.1 UDP-N-acetylglucosamine 2-epimerase (non-hydrolyzing) [Noviherbaspirillum galbum]